MYQIIGIISLMWFTALASSTVEDPRCSIAYDGIDLKTKLYKKEMTPQYLFRYTPRELKNELQQDNLLHTYGQLIKIEDQIYLNLNIEVFSKKAAEEYGSIEQGYVIKIKTIDGKTYELNCRAGSRGQRFENEKTYLYSISYTLDKSDIKGLQKAEIDKIGIQWASGFEDYDIYEIDFFINQLKCLLT